MKIHFYYPNFIIIIYQYCYNTSIRNTPINQYSTVKKLTKDPLLKSTWWAKKGLFCGETLVTYHLKKLGLHISREETREYTGKRNKMTKPKKQRTTEQKYKLKGTAVPQQTHQFVVLERSVFTIISNPYFYTTAH